MEDIQELTYDYPLIALKGLVVLPDNRVSIEVGRQASVNAVNVALERDKYIVVVAQKDPNLEMPKYDDLYNVGVLCSIKERVNLPNGTKRIMLEALKRVKIQAFNDSEELTFVTVKELEFEGEIDNETAILCKMISQQFSDLVDLQKKRNPKLEYLKSITECSHAYCNIITFNVPMTEIQKQEILEIDNLNDRLLLLLKRIKALNEFVEVEKKIAEKVKDSMDKSQKEYYLREQLKAIHNELGDDENEIEGLRTQILAKKMPKEVEEKALKELSRMSRMNSSSPDYTVLRGYLDWIIDLPFNFVGDDCDIKYAKNVLEKEHYGLEKVKDRILEYLAVYKLTGKLNGPIICLVGPPGVGKTSIAGSIARALNRNFVRMSLGGVKDEAEIRGHRKTYIGAMPGRIIFGLKEAKCANPVFLLDEIDKISSDLRGDPASALLEVLDPEQNSTFRDRYLEIPYDLSKVMFVTTANSLDTIPQPLLDRMEVLTISGYTYQEKEEIAKRYLIPRQIEVNGLNDNLIRFTDEGIKLIIEGYTKEAGVRSLEREIASVCRKVATEYSLSKKDKKRKIDEKAVIKYLGNVKFGLEEKVESNDVGVATGLAWTQVGGTTLSIEVNVMEGKGDLILTGKLGEVMQESAKTAFSYIKSNAEKYGIKEDAFTKHDIHVHVPEGATPKDGPSAGITLATAILSALTGRKVRNDVSMTGEITLRGRVLAIGGLKEKSLASYKIGVKNIIIPKANEKDIEEIPNCIVSELNFIPVKDYDEVYKNAFVNE